MSHVLLRRTCLVLLQRKGHCRCRSNEHRGIFCHIQKVASLDIFSGSGSCGSGSESSHGGRGRAIPVPESSKLNLAPGSDVPRPISGEAGGNWRNAAHHQPARGLDPAQRLPRHRRKRGQRQRLWRRVRVASSPSLPEAVPPGRRAKEEERIGPADGHRRPLARVAGGRSQDQTW